MLYQDTTIRFKQFHTARIGTHQREFAEGEVLHVPVKSHYENGEVTPYEAALMVMGKKAEVVHAR